MQDSALERAAWYVRTFGKLNRLRYQTERVRIDEVLTANGWKARSRNSWQKREGRREATITLREDASLQGSGDLQLLAEGYQLLKRSNGLLC